MGARKGSVKRTNRGGGMGSTLSAKHAYGLPIQTADRKLVDRAKKWHWGVPATQAVEWNDPDYPERMVEIGRLAEMKVRLVGETRESSIEIPEEWWSDFPKDGTHAKVNNGTTRANRRLQTHLVFDADHPSQRLYICLPAPLMAEFRLGYHPEHAQLLSDLAEKVGGRHARHRDYPSVLASPMGILTHVLYVTYKKGDENKGTVRSTYDHEMGEEGGISPMLAVDKFGRLWIVGGSYTGPIPGISN